MDFINNNTINPGRGWLADKKHRFWVGVALLLVAGNVLFGVGYMVKAEENRKLQEQVQSKKTREQVVLFLDLFIQKVLKTDKEVSFEDRLKLENAIRDIGDPELLSKWEQFTGGTSEREIQQGVKDLLEALVRKIS